MIEFGLSGGHVALIDEQDLPLVEGMTWFVSNKGYAIASTHVDGRIVNFYMHRVITGAVAGMVVDHKDRNRLNNQRSNLRLCSYSLNNGNLPKRAACSSKFKGVCWNKQKAKWHTRIKIDGKAKHLGFFSDEIEAARACNDAAPSVFGEFARLNVLP